MLIKKVDKIDVSGLLVTKVKKLQEELILGDGISVIILDRKGSLYTVGLKVPKDVEVIKLQIDKDPDDT